MEHDYILSCESTVDIPYSYVTGRGMPVLFYHYSVEGKEYDDDMGRDPDGLKKFYGFIDAGHIPSTSQLNPYQYEEFLRGLLQQGDVVHVCLGTGMTTSYNNAVTAAGILREEFPDRKLAVIDSTCSCGGYGMFVDYLADLRDEGKSMDELVAWAEANKHKLFHEFYNEDLRYFRRTGRMSGPAAGLAMVINIVPKMRLNYDGRIIAYGKVRGKKNAIKGCVQTMLENASGGRDYRGKCFINDARNKGDAALLRDALIEAFPNLNEDNIRMGDIGTIIASHCGPGTLSFYFMSDGDRPE